MTHTIDLKKAQEELKAVIDEYGKDHIYDVGDEAYYSYTECIVGCVLKRLGLDDDELELLDKNGLDSTFDSKRVQALLSDFNLSFTTEAIFYLKKAQTTQDDGQSWGAAYHHAEDEVVGHFGESGGS